MRSWAIFHIKPCLNSQLTDQQKEDILDELFHQYATRVAAEPEKHGMDYVEVNLCVEKIVETGAWRENGHSNMLPADA